MEKPHGKAGAAQEVLPAARMATPARGPPSLCPRVPKPPPRVSPRMYPRAPAGAGQQPAPNSGTTRRTCGWESMEKPGTGSGNSIPAPRRGGKRPRRRDRDVLVPKDEGPGCPPTPHPRSGAGIRSRPSLRDLWPPFPVENPFPAPPPLPARQALPASASAPPRAPGVSLVPSPAPCAIPECPLQAASVPG